VTPSAPADGLTVNGRAVDRAGIPPDERLLDTLRWRLGLKGTKEGCRSGGCGACTVLLDGRAALACLVLTSDLDRQAVTTIEGITSDGVGHQVQSSFEAEAALQCGYCTPGFVVAVTALVKELGPQATTARVLEELPGNLCRCTGYASIIRAVRRLTERPL
jgi:aerobic carbon-monoxide dehydrogenase small subunit